MAEVSVSECLREAYESCEPLIEEKGLAVVSHGTDFSVQGVRELLVCLWIHSWMAGTETIVCCREIKKLCTPKKSLKMASGIRK